MSGTTLLVDGGGTLALAEPVAVAGQALGVVPAHAVTVHRDRPRGSARNAWPVIVRELVPSGTRVRVQCDGQPAVVAEVTPEAVAELQLSDGEQVWASVKATEVTVVLL